MVLGLNCQNKPNGFSSCFVLRGGAEIDRTSNELTELCIESLFMVVKRRFVIGKSCFN